MPKAGQLPGVQNGSPSNWRNDGQVTATDFLDAVVSNWNRASDSTFRDPDAPYYWVSARLWLVMTLNRIAAEVPVAVVPHVQLLLRAATDPDLPHILIREHAKQAVLRLVSDGHATGADIDVDSLPSVNEPRLPRADVERPHGSDYRVDPRPEREQTFAFDVIDTLPYVYSPLLSLFPHVEMRDILSRAEHWIVGNWAAPATANSFLAEPRKARFDERRYGEWTPSHGEPPIVERYGYYLEWNAMMCVVGELLRTHAVIKSDVGFTSFERWFARYLPTEPDSWLADIREPTPLETRLWGAEPVAADALAESLTGSEITGETGINQRRAPEWIVVGASYDVHLPLREVHTAISSALVSPRTASALVRALQSANDSNDFRLPDEGDELEIDRTPYRLLGWLSGNHVELGFDDRDPLRHQAVPVGEVPGRAVKTLLNLERHSGAQATWTVAATREKVVVAEVWNDLSEGDSDRWSHKTASGGWRLWMRASDLEAFLTHEGMDLICEVQIVSQSHREGSRRYEPQEGKPRTIDRILLLRRDGRIEDAAGRIEAWSAARRGASA